MALSPTISSPIASARYVGLRSKQRRGCMRKECTQCRGLKKAEALVENLFKVHGINATYGK